MFLKISGRAIARFPPLACIGTSLVTYGLNTAIVICGSSELRVLNANRYCF